MISGTLESEESKMTQTVEQATKALWDYINGLPPDQRTKAIEYQKGLEAEAASTEGGMMAVINKRLLHNNARLVECLGEVREIAAEVVSSVVADDLMKKLRKS